MIGGSVKTYAEKIHQRKARIQYAVSEKSAQWNTYIHTGEGELLSALSSYARCGRATVNGGEGAEIRQYVESGLRVESDGGGVAWQHRAALSSLRHSAKARHSYSTPRHRIYRYKRTKIIRQAPLPLRKAKNLRCRNARNYQRVKATGMLTYYVASQYVSAATRPVTRHIQLTRASTMSMVMLETIGC